MITKNMKLIVSVAVMSVLVLTLPLLSLAAAQQRGGFASYKYFPIGKKGDVHFTEPVRVGDVLLQPGMYRVQHVEDGSEHAVVFKKMDMPAGYRHGNTPVSEEVAAQFKCKAENTGEKVRKTEVGVRTNAAGEQEVTEVEIAGETFKHLN